MLTLVLKNSFDEYTSAGFLHSNKTATEFINCIENESTMHKTLKDEFPIIEKYPTTKIIGEFYSESEENSSSRTSKRKRSLIENSDDDSGSNEKSSSDDEKNDTSDDDDSDVSREYQGTMRSLFKFQKLPRK